MSKFKSGHPEELEDSEDGNDPIDLSKAETGDDLHSQIHQHQNLNPDYFHARYREWAEKIQSIQTDLRKIIDDKTSPKRKFESKKEEFKHFQHRINSVKSHLSRIKFDHKGMWLFVHENPLNISGVLFDPELAVDLQAYREALKKLFIGFDRTNNSFESHLKSTFQLVTVCEALALSKETPCVTSTGIIASSSPEVVDLVLKTKFDKRPRKRR